MIDLDKITILGGSGFIGSQLTAKLSKSTKRIVILSRNELKNRDLLVIPNLEIIQMDVNDERSLREHTKDSDLLINTIGILNEMDKINTFEQVHYKLVEKISRVIKANNIKRYLHISSLNADKNAPSKYLRTKGMAEELLIDHTSSSSNVTIFRPSIVFGENDSFFNKFAVILKYLPMLPLACPSSRFMPVYVGDLTSFMISAINDKETFNISIDVTGPKEYTFHQLMKLTIKFLGIKRLIIPLNDILSRMQAYIFEKLPGKLFTTDNYLSLKIDSISKKGFKGTTSIEDVVPEYLNVASNKNRMAELRKKSGRNE